MRAGAAPLRRAEGRRARTCALEVVRQARHRGLQVPRHRRRRRRYTQFEDKPTFDEVEVLANRYLDELRHRASSTGSTWRTRSSSASARQMAVVETLLPLGVARRPTKQAKQPAGGAVEVRVPAVGREHPGRGRAGAASRCELFKCFLDAAVSEQIARMVAMKAATENAGEMIKQLSHAHTTAPARRRSPARSWRSSAASRRLNRLIASQTAASPDVESRTRQPNATTNTTASNRMATATATATSASITQVIGSTFDVEFAEEHLPEIYNAVKIDAEHKGVKINLTGEVQQHLGGGRVRCVALGCTDGLVRGMDVRRHRRPGDGAGRQGDARPRLQPARRADRRPRPGRRRGALADPPRRRRRSPTCRPRPSCSRPASRSSTC